MSEKFDLVFTLLSLNVLDVGEHFLFAFRFAALLFAAAGAALAHAFLPFLFEKTASKIVARLYAKTHNRGA